MVLTTLEEVSGKGAPKEEGRRKYNRRIESSLDPFSERVLSSWQTYYPSLLGASKERSGQDLRLTKHPRWQDTRDELVPSKLATTLLVTVTRRTKVNVKGL